MTSLTPETTAIYAFRCPDLHAKLPFLTSAQMQRLEEFFAEDKNPQIADVIIIAAELGLPVQAVRIWFDNRLSQWRESQGLPPNWKLLNHS
ncbi:homeodomain-only protein-like [Tropilaelaps mercedesae]|uniref:Homeodomain-only protein n=1 Tax=Tropilaelaps mercedesae TaxID=418985 RepID=A0A1V9XUB4_9ACAR|nr:homeodomain-only protein-like [Tropilaelaps mercedesae]